MRSSDTSGLQTSVHETALEDAKAEKQQLLSQIHVLKEQNISIKEDLQNTEDQHAIEMEQTLQQVTMTQESLEEERTRHGNTQDELNRLTEVSLHYEMAMSICFGLCCRNLIKPNTSLLEKKECLLQN